MLKLNVTLMEILFLDLFVYFRVLYLTFNAVADFLEGFIICCYVLINFFDYSYICTVLIF